MALAYLQIFQDAAEYINLLDDAQRGRILSAMMAYAFQDETPSFESGMEKMAWIALRRMIDQSRNALENKRAGGRARQRMSAEDQQETAAVQQDAAEGQQVSADIQQTAADDQQEAAEGSNIQESRIKIQESRNKKQDLNGGEKRARTRFTPPTAEEVRSYCTEKGIRVDGDRFIAYYESNGWRVGKNPMKDWRAALRTWALRDPPCTNAPKGGKVVREQQYSQRPYAHNEDALDKLMNGTTGGVSS